MTHSQDIRIYYAGLNDYQLVKLRDEEWTSLTSEAQQYLSEEIHRRKIFTETDHPSSDTDEIREEITWMYSKDTLHFIIEKKSEEAANQEIVDGLMEMGLEAEEAERLLTQMPTYYKEKVQQANVHFLTGVLLIFSSMALKVLPVPYSRKTAMLILVTFLMIGGVIKFFHGWLNKRKFEKLLRQDAR